MPTDYEYDVALSFAGEDRGEVSPVAEGLKRAGVNVFYDAFEVADLWGKDLYQHFTKVYFERSRFFVPFLSQSYAQKPWTRHELRNAQARAFQQEHSEYILPVRLDVTEIPGILPTTGYVRYDDYGADGLVNLILEKLDQSSRSPVALHGDAASRAPLADIYLPKVKKEFTDRERDVFLRQAFEEIMRYFEQGLEQLQASDADIETDFEPISRVKFAASVYVKGTVANRCKIWRGGDGEINFSSGRSIDLGNDNSLNERYSVQDDGHRLILTSMMSGMWHRGEKESEDGSARSAAASLWRHFLEPLDHAR